MNPGILRRTYNMTTDPRLWLGSAVLVAGVAVSILLASRYPGHAWTIGFLSGGLLHLLLDLLPDPTPFDNRGEEE